MSANTDLADNMNQLISTLKEKKDEIKRQRIERGTQEKFSKLTSKDYPLAGGNAIIGPKLASNKAVALAEMRRVVTARRPRFNASVWQSLDPHPFYETLDKVIQQRLGMSALRDIFTLGSADELRALAVTPRTE